MHEPGRNLSGVFSLYIRALTNTYIPNKQAHGMNLIPVPLVEDEPLLALDVETALVDAGYSVVIAPTGEEALAALASMQVPFTAIITDIRLGKGPDGWAVAKRARELIAGIPVVYMSGDSAADWTSMGVPTSVMLSKPMAMSQIIVALAHLINANQASAILSPNSDG